MNSDDVPGRDSALPKGTVLHAQDAGEGRDQRREALSQLAADATRATGSGQPDVQKRRTLGKRETVVRISRGPSDSHRRLAVLSLILLLLMGATTVLRLAFLSNTGAHSPTRAPLTILPARNGLQCTRGMAWSPDGLSLAVLGSVSEPDTCAVSSPAAYSYIPGLIQIYSMTSGDMERQIQPDALIQRALGLHAPAASLIHKLNSSSDISQQVINYSGIAWGRTGQLALTFSVNAVTREDSAGNYTYANTCGLILVNASTNDPRSVRILSHKLTATETCSFAWDLATGSYLNLVPSKPSASSSWF